MGGSIMNPLIHSSTNPFLHWLQACLACDEQKKVWRAGFGLAWTYKHQNPLPHLRHVKAKPCARHPDLLFREIIRWPSGVT